MLILLPRLPFLQLLLGILKISPDPHGSSKDLPLGIAIARPDALPVIQPTVSKQLRE